MSPKRRPEHFLTKAEFIPLGQVLEEVSNNGSQESAGAVTAIRLLLTGCRKTKIKILPWQLVELDSAEMDRQRQDRRP